MTNETDAPSVATKKEHAVKKDALGTVVLVAIVAICLYIWYKTSDFALALVLITAAFFVIWLGD